MIRNNTYYNSDLSGRNLKIALVGCGGTGSYLSKELIQIAKTMKALDPDSNLSVTYYDPSTVTESNLARQNFFPTMVGCNKAEALVWEANNLHGLSFKANNQAFSASNLSSYHLIITALDRPSTRFKLYEAGMKKSGKTLWLDCGNDATSGQILLGELCDTKGTRLPTICDFFDYSTLTDDEADRKSCSAIESLYRQQPGVNATAARIAGQLLNNLLFSGQLTTHGAFFDAKSLSSSPIDVNGDEWDIFGYTSKAA
ncbi:PRTRC system ThiF family protein [Vibrio mediterranei]|uniref:PRTRC system ThiF family protein n=1 Tax=Vibrio mediterranei TaxID=689 RepID=UPI004067DEE4